MKIYNKGIMFSVITCIVTACATPNPTNNKPAWINNPHANHPETTYLAAVGSADNLASAQNRATANIAKIFGVQVNAQTDSFSNVNVQKNVIDSSGNLSSVEIVEKKQNLSSQINTSVKQLVSGIQLVEQWEDSLGQFYVLAVLNKAKAASSLSMQISELELSIDNLMQQAIKKIDPIEKITLLNQPQHFIKQRNIIAQKLQLLRPGSVMPPQWTLAQLQAQQHAAYKKLKIQVIHASQDTYKIASMVSSSLATAHISLSEPYNYLILTDIKMQRPTFNNNWHWQRASVQIQLHKLPDRTTQKTLTWNFKASASSSSELALERLLAKIRKKIDADLVKELLSATDK